MNAPVAPSVAAQAATAPRPESRPPRPRRAVRRWLLRILPLAVLVGAVIGGTWYWQTGRFLVETDDAYVQGDIALLGPRIEADVEAIHVADNQPVRAGQPLLTLDDRDARTSRDQAAAALAEARAALDVARQSRAQMVAQIDQAAAQIDQARAEQVRANADANRARQLVGAGWTSRQTNDQAVADQRKAEAALHAAEAELAVRRQALPVQDAQIAQAEARQAQAAAALAAAENTLSYTVIRAPFDGIAGNRAAQLGQHVRPGQRLIAVAPQPDLLYIVANFKETQLARVRPGQPVEISVDAIPDRVFHARVDSFAPGTGSQFSLLPPENATGNFTKIVQRVPVKLVLEPGQDTERLRAGLSAIPEIDAREHPERDKSILGAIRQVLSLGE